MKKSGLILMSIGLLSLLSKGLIGSRVATDGTLVEPFFLLPIGFFSLFLGLLVLLIEGIQKASHH